MARDSGSIRVRLTLWYSAILLGGQCLSGALIWLLLSHSLHSDLDDSLKQRTKGLERYLALEASDNLSTFAHEMDEFSRSLPVDYVIFVQDSAGHILANSGGAGDALPRSAPRLEQSGIFGNTKVRGIRYRFFGETYQERNRQYQVILASSSAFIDTTLDHLAFLLLITIPGVIAIAATGGLWMSKRALSPVIRMTAAANAIDFNNLSTRLDVPPARDEIQTLATTWNAMLQRIENSAIRINRFTADASHELRTPLSLIQATTDLALRRPRDQEGYREALRVIRTECERMTGLVEDLLFLARADSDAGPRHKTGFDLQIPLQAAALEIMPKAAVKNVPIRLDIPETAVHVSGDQDAIRRLLVVLVDNAVKYSPNGKTVTAALKVENTDAILSVHDTGCGIPADAVPLIFERFYRADSSRHAESPSYGLGLSIAHVVAVQHGASIHVASEPGSTFFTVRFPASSF